VGPDFQPTEERQRAVFCFIDRAELEDVIWANFDAVLFAFAARAIHEWSKMSGLGLAVLARALGMFRGTLGLGRILLERTHVELELSSQGPRLARFSRMVNTSLSRENSGFARRK